MKIAKVAAILLLGILLVSGLACGSASKEVCVNDSCSGKKVSVAVGGWLTVTLDSNPSTGFSWALAENSDESVLQEAGHQYVAPETSGTPVPGKGGEEVWIFRALKEGTSTISMEYKQPWDEDTEPAETFDLTVVVK